MRSDILTYSGHYFSFEDLESNVIAFDDIAHGLSNICRFAGQCPVFYSVAEHSVEVANIVRNWLGVTDPKIWLQALLHDATEAYIGDMTSPLKRIMPEYQELEGQLHRQIMRNFNLPCTLDPAVKRADLIMLAIEKREIWRNSDEWALLKGMEPPAEYTLEQNVPREAELRFRVAFKHIARRVLESAE
jgi:hypothetical protein